MGQRKINRNESVTKRLGFKPVEAYGYLCVGLLTNVELAYADVDADKATELAGMKVPTLRFDFQQAKTNTLEPDRYHTHYEFPITASINGEPLEEDDVWESFVEMWNRIAHLLDQYKTVDGFRPFPSDPVFTPDGDVKKRLAEVEKLFKTTVEVFNGADGKSPFYTKTPIAMKLIAVVKKSTSGKRYRQLQIPRWVGKGCFELAKFKDKKLITSLEFTGSETWNTKEPIVASGAANAGATQENDSTKELDPAVKAALGIVE